MKGNDPLMRELYKFSGNGNRIMDPTKSRCHFCDCANLVFGTLISGVQYCRLFSREEEIGRFFFRKLKFACRSETGRH